MPTKRLFVADLFDQTRPENGGAGAGAFLYCPKCGSEYSANKHDYWFMAPDEPFTCRGPVGLRHRKTNLQLMRRQSRLVPA